MLTPFANVKMNIMEREDYVPEKYYIREDNNKSIKSLVTGNSLISQSKEKEIIKMATVKKTPAQKQPIIETTEVVVEKATAKVSTDTPVIVNIGAGKTVKITDESIPAYRLKFVSKYDELYRNVKVGKTIECDPIEVSRIFESVSKYIKKGNIKAQVKSSAKLGRVWIIAKE